MTNHPHFYNLLNVKHYFGRLIDHVHLVVKDLEKSKGFYRMVLQSIGKDLTYESTEAFASDELYVSPVEKNFRQSHVHLAFQVSDREMVHKFYEAALKAGGTDNGKPGERNYHPGYYAGFILDPDGNNIEAVFHGAADRSAEAVIITPK